MRTLLVIGAVIVLTACQTASSAPTPTARIMPQPATTSTAIPVSTTAPPPTTTAAPSTTATTTTTTTLPPGVAPPPEWLGSRPLAVDATGDPMASATPPELSDRRFTSADILPPPPDGEFRSSIGAVTPEVAARSTWNEECPVPLEDLAYLTVTFVGFDQRPHTGELIVNAAAADDMVEVFHALFEERFPIEQVAITTLDDLDAEPTGDTNVTTAFVCRPVTGGSGWSEHAYGLAIDVNPFHNPYLRGDTVLPELAGDYLDRRRDLPGMITEGDAVTRAFDAIGWEWGGRWSSLKDWQHFSLHGR